MCLQKSYSFIQGKETDADILFELVKQRILWMNEKNIRQWNCHGYLEKYPLPYYRELAGKGHLYLLKCGTKTAAAGILLDEDPRWKNDGKKAIYIHHLVSAPDEKGAGKRFIEAVKKLAEENGISLVRLDCAADNEKLNRYYESLGFVSRESFTEGVYRGLQKEYRSNQKRT